MNAFSILQKSPSPEIKTRAQRYLKSVTDENLPLNAKNQEQNFFSLDPPENPNILNNAVSEPQ